MIYGQKNVANCMKRNDHKGTNGGKMATDKNFIDFTAEQINNAGAITFKKMFGEYALYSDGKVVALVCDNQLFVKPTESGKEFIGNPTMGAPYPGAKLYFHIEDQLEDREWISDLIRITAKEVKPPVKKKFALKRK